MSLVSIAFGALGLVALLLFIRSFRASVKARDLTPTFWLLFAAVLLSNLTSLVSQYTGGRTIVTSGIESSVAILSPTAHLVSSLTLPVMAGLSGVYVLTRLRRGMVINGLAVLFALVLLLGAMAGAMHGFPLFTPARLALLIPVLAIVVAPPGMDGLRGAASAAALLVSLGALLALVSPEQAALACGARKCGAFGSLYVGVSFSFNAFGLLLALFIPVLYFGLRRYSTFFVLLAFVLVLASGSRTAQVASAVSLLLVLMHQRSVRRQRPSNPVLPLLVCLGAIAATVAFPLIGLRAGVFTGRVGLWELALSRLEDTWLVGNGPDAWAALTGVRVISGVSSYSTHNQFMEVLFISGVLGVAVFALMAGLVVRRNRSRLAEFAILMSPVLLVSSTERPWSLGLMDWTFWSILLVLVLRFPTIEHTSSEPHLATLKAGGVLGPERRPGRGAASSRAR